MRVAGSSMTVTVELTRAAAARRSTTGILRARTAIAVAPDAHAVLAHDVIAVGQPRDGFAGTVRRVRRADASRTLVMGRCATRAARGRAAQSSHPQRTPADSEPATNTAGEATKSAWRGPALLRGNDVLDAHRSIVGHDDVDPVAAARVVGGNQGRIVGAC